MSSITDTAPRAPAAKPRLPCVPPPEGGEDMTTTTIERPRANASDGACYGNPAADPATVAVAARRSCRGIRRSVRLHRLAESRQRRLLRLVHLFVAALCFSWLRATHLNPRAVLLRNWRWGVTLGLGVRAPCRSSSSGRRLQRRTPEGLAFAGAIIWRGLLYGIADGLLLSVFPILVVFEAFRRGPLLREHAARRLWGRLRLQPRLSSRLSTTSATRTSAARSSASP